MRFGSWMLSGVLRDAAKGEGDGGGGAAPPPPAIDMKALAELVGKTIDERLKAKEDAAKAAAEEDAQRKAEEEERKRQEAAEAAAKNGGDKDAVTKALELKLTRLQADLDKERKLRTDTETRAAARERETTIRSALDKFDYAKAGGKETAYRHIKDDIKTGADGKLTGPDGTPLTEYLGALFETELDYLLAPKKTGGSGASGAQGSGGGAISLADIKPGANLDAARAEIARLAKQTMLGQ